MKSRTLTWFTVMNLFAGLAIPVGLPGQKQDDKPKHHDYRLIDMGTFGGPMSFINPPFNSFPALNIRGTTVGGFNTATPLSPTSNLFVCAGTFSGVPNVFHTFAWRNGVVSDLGALAPAKENCSNAGSVNAGGEISGVSEIDDIDPVLGVKEFRAVL